MVSESAAKREQAELEKELKKLEIQKLKADIAEQKQLARAAKYRADDEQMDLEYRQFNDEVSKLREQNRILYLSGIVTPTMAGYVHSDLQSWKFRDEVRDVEHAPVTVVINSPGGYVIPGLEIYDTIKDYQQQGWTINTRCTGIAMSMAAVLLQAGETREITPRSTFMLHEISSEYVGKTSDVRNQLHYTEALQRHLSEILAERAAVSVDEIEEMWQNTDVFLTAEETKAKGFVDRITNESA